MTDKHQIEHMDEIEGSPEPNGEKGRKKSKASGAAKKSKTKSKLEMKVKELTTEKEELKDKYLRLFAEFDNYKKRMIREKLDLLKSAAQDTMSALLPVLDDFDRAKKSADDEGTEEVFSDGVEMVYKKLYSILEQKGLEPMKTDGEIFDPEKHEAISEIDSNKEMKGKIVDTIEKGYFLNKKIIRFAKVVVGK